MALWLVSVRVVAKVVVWGWVRAVVRLTVKGMETGLVMATLTVTAVVLVAGTGQVVISLDAVAND